MPGRSPEDSADGFQDQDRLPRPGQLTRIGILRAMNSDKQARTTPKTPTASRTRTAARTPTTTRTASRTMTDKCPELSRRRTTGSKTRTAAPDSGASSSAVDNNIIILDKIKFQKASAEILPEAEQDHFDAMSDDALAPPRVHAPRGGGQGRRARAHDEYNLKLTQDRVKTRSCGPSSRGGSSARRLRSKGYGEYCPLDPAHSNEAAWEENRRQRVRRSSSRRTSSAGVELGRDNASSARSEGRPDARDPPRRGYVCRKLGGVGHRVAAAVIGAGCAAWLGAALEKQRLLGRLAEARRAPGISETVEIATIAGLTRPSSGSRLRAKGSPTTRARGNRFLIWTAGVSADGDGPGLRADGLLAAVEPYYF